MGERGEATTDPYDSDALHNMKHKPFLRVEGTTAVAVVGLGAVTGVAGDLIHPMVNSSDPSILHWIDTIWVEDQAGKIIGMRRLSPTEPAPATLTFSIPAGTTQMTAHQHCNQHGSFKGQVLTIDAVQTVANLKPQCKISSCTGLPSEASLCASSVAEYSRLYSREFKRSSAVDGNTNLKHKPSLTLHGNGSASVLVGQENVRSGNITYHPMTASTDPSLVHWINSIWVVDQSGVVVASRQLLPDEAGPASLTFAVPAGTTKLTAHEYCNIHGLFAGDEMPVASSDASPSAASSCSVRSCPGESAPNFALSTDCFAFVADAKRRQVLENGRSPLAFPLPYILGAANEKHNPYVVLDGLIAKVVVGKGAATGIATDPVHPMVDDPSQDGANIHFIDTMWVEDQSGQLLTFRALSSSEPSPATLYFDIPVGTTSVHAYQYCNIHGLFKGDEVAVTPANTRAGARSGCSVQQCAEGSAVSACQGFTSELRRRQGSAAKDDPSGKHKPYLWVNGTTATIVVGLGATPGHAGGLIHPMTPSNETDYVHFISHVYAMDDMQNLVALCEMLPTDPAPATCSFEVPPGVIFLKPYEFCNVHGLYAGDIVQVSASNATASRQCNKRECTAGQPTLNIDRSAPAQFNACDFWKAELLRRQMGERGEATTDPYDSDALHNMKHKPFLRVEGTTAVAVVGLGAVTGVAGDLIHPMVNSSDPSILHWIDTIWVEDQAGKIIGMRRLSPTEPAPATLTFSIPAGTTQMTAHQHCNQHGSFKGQVLTIDAVQTVANLKPQCKISSCTGLPSEASLCASSVAEYSRLYSREFKRSSAVDGNTNLKHKPSLTLHGNGSASVLVGQENVRSGNITYHPMTASTDPSLVHWINSIWVVDQSGVVVASRQLLPDEAGPASLTFAVPAGTTKLTAHEYCNIHGLFAGDEMPVASSDASPSAASSCSVRSCPGESAPNFALSTDCFAFVADAKRRQVLENGRSPLAFPLPYILGAANEKHNPYVVLDGLIAKVVVGKGAATGIATDPVHPMVDDPSQDGANIHFIDTMWVEDQSGQLLTFRALSSSEPSPATLYFDIPVGTTSVHAYQYCNIHGLFKGDEVAVTPANTRAGARSGCSVQQCAEGSAVSACQGFTSELRRRQGSAAKDDPSGKHKPYLWVNGTTATIVVGLGATPGHAGGLIHPMTPSNETDYVHFISHVYAMDDMQNLVALCEMLPTDPAPATCSFEVPPGVIFLKPYEFCNVHGLYAGDIVQVSASNATASRQCNKRECTAGQPTLSAVSFASSAVEAIYTNQKAATARISSSNMCLQHKALFYLSKSLVDVTLQAQIDQLTEEGDTVSDTVRRTGMFASLLPLMTSLGGKWHASEVVLEHTGANTSLRLDLIDESQLRFTQRVLGAGKEAFVDGLDTPVMDARDLLVIEATFGMDWGYAMSANLGPHYTIFYSPNFTAEVVHVALCAKTQGWMGMGWLGPSHVGHLMNNTDMVMAFVKDGQAVVQDRFAKYIEEPLKDEMLEGQRQDDLGLWTGKGANDLVLHSGALGTPGKEWCADATCKPGFSLVQFSRPFTTGDAWDAKLPVVGAKIGMIHAFASSDPTETETSQHIMSTTGYKDLQWNLDCPAGTYFNMYTIECKPCDRGLFRPEGASVASCLLVPLGTYQNKTGQAVPRPCPESFTTLERGSTKDDACVCPGPSLDSPNGRYHVHTCGGGPLVTEDGKPTACARLGQCVDCPKGTICEGGRDIPKKLQAEGRRMQSSKITAARKRVEEFCANFVYASTQACTSKNFCLANLADLDCEHTMPKKLDGFYVEGDAGSRTLAVFKCPVPGQCPESTEMQACSSGWQGRVCWRCGPGTAEGVRAAFCKGCDPVNLIGIPMFVLGLYALYRCTVHSVFGRISASYMLLGNIALAATSMQSIGVVIGLVPNLPPALAWLYKLSNLFVLNIEMVMPSCHFGDGFVDRLLFKWVPWSGIVLGYCFLYVTVNSIAKVTSRMPAMVRESVFNCAGLCIQALFVKFAMDSVTYWIQLEHPSGPATLAHYPDVVWLSTEHLGSMWAQLPQFLVSVVAVYTYVVYVCWTAPESFAKGNSKFVKRNSFILARWRPGVFWWGIVTITRNLSLALVPVLVKEIVLRSTFMVTLLMTHACLEATYQPWRTKSNNVVSIGCSTVLALMAVVCTSFTQEHGPNVEAGAIAMNALMFFLLSAILLSFPYIIWARSVRKLRAVGRMRHDALVQSVSAARQIKDKYDIPEAAFERGAIQPIAELLSPLNALSDYDAQILFQSLVLYQDLLGVSFAPGSSSRRHRMSTMLIPEPQKKALVLPHLLRQPQAETNDAGKEADPKVEEPARDSDQQENATDVTLQASV